MRVAARRLRREVLCGAVGLMVSLAVGLGGCAAGPSPARQATETKGAPGTPATAPAAPSSASTTAGASPTPAPPPSAARSPAGPGPSRTASGVPAFSHVFIIVMENLGYGGAIGLPYVSSLLARYAAATAYDSVAHPSLPNYLALTSGNTWVTSDCFFCYQSAPNLASEAAAAGVSWGGYMEGLPSPCYLGPFDLGTDYAGKHDPFRYYNDVRGSAGLCAGIQPLTNLEALLPAVPAPASSPGTAAGLAARIPRLAWITPNLCNDGHDCAATKADAWLSTFVPRILASPAWQDGGVLFITWDESYGGDDAACCGIPAGQGGGHVLTLVVAPGLPAGMRVSVPYDHYSLLATIEDGLGLPLLGHAATTPPMSAFWASGAGP
jgi:hypothetical protein